jgi:hypothetical protein
MGVGDVIGDGDVLGTGWAVAASVVMALATNVPTNARPTNQRFMGGFPPYWRLKFWCLVASYPGTRLL